MTWQTELEQMKNSGIEKLTSTSIQTSSKTMTVCSLCNGSGWELYRGEDGSEYARECSCRTRQKQIQESRLRFASIPETYKDIRLKDISTKYYKKSDSKTTIKAVAEFVKWYMDNLDENVKNGKGIYLWSDVKGSGKTMLAASIANELIHGKGKFVKFATSLDILDEIRSSYDKDTEKTESKLLNDLVNTDFLVIDDFGTERVSEWVGEKFYQIVNKRYINKKVTFFTSNYNLETINYDDRITSRIRERSFVIHFPEESVRELKARLENTTVSQAQSG